MLLDMILKYRVNNRNIHFNITQWKQQSRNTYFHEAGSKNESDIPKYPNFFAVISWLS
jgi:hypothetical protein